jgi:hypothetical protein
LIAVAVGVSLQGVECVGESDYEEEEYDVEEPHLINDLEDHPDQVTDISVDSQEVEHLEPEEDDAETVDGPLDADQVLHRVFILLVEAADCYELLSLELFHYRYGN